MTQPIKLQHLAELIEEEMRERHWTVTDLVLNMGPFPNAHEWGICQLSWELFLTVRTPNVVLGDVMAEQLEAAFGVSKQFFNAFHENWRQAELARNTKRMA